MGDHLGIVTHYLQFVFIIELIELLLGELGEAKAVGLDDLLAAGDLVLGTAEGLLDSRNGGRLAADGDQRLMDRDTGDGASWLTEGVTHTSLEPIGTGAGKHFLLTDNMERVDTDAHVEGVLTSGLLDVFIASDTAGFERLGGDLLLLPR